MNRFNILLIFFFVFLGARAQDSQSLKADEKMSSEGYISYGAEIDSDSTVATAEMGENYQVLKVTDTAQVKFAATVAEVCQAKGCWMKLKLDNGQQTMVRFKDYGFFMPLDIAGKEVIVNGKAFVEEMSVEDQRHYAKDAGKTAEEIAKITSPKKTYGFVADGVLVKN
ncbi:DUF4920 domain-containing protein [Aggregatimonas sangjinii]|uniref:DUF4920 domain-containing protein n=1 Tax=Aggregatimonas sangjinii TaxID=2583587 RepID=A0A5B7SUI7_9FLAO|nr:DUF4920 domain-containing protein [Aggregatimonas sangjinii]QCX00833.1 DUF4920 domain-containing protein [Aggregatimonas sangjinii]